jgi:hypothetical protein
MGRNITGSFETRVPASMTSDFLDVYGSHVEVTTLNYHWDYRNIDAVKQKVKEQKEQLEHLLVLIEFGENIIAQIETNDYCELIVESKS